MQEVGFGSNYVLSTSNILVPRIMSEVGFGSNYVLSTSNILVPRIMTEVGYTSNYVVSTSNILVSRIMTEAGKNITDYFALNNKPIILIPTTTNLQVVSGYDLLVPAKLGIGTSSTINNVLQVGSGGRLRIANATTDYSMIGSSDVDALTNTRIVIYGNTHTTSAGTIQYCAPTTSGSHIFYTSATQITRMTISSAGVNVNNNFGVGGNVGIATSPHLTYQLDIQGTQPRLRLIDPATNGNSVIMFRELNDLYGMDISYVGNTDKKMYITTFNNSSTPVVRVAIDRIGGNVGIGTTDTATYKLNVNGTTYSGSDITTGGSIYLNGWLSKLGSSAAAWQTQSNIGTYWFIDLTSPLLYGGGNATLNIHNLVVWVSSTGSTFFAVLGFSSSYPPEAFKLSQYARNKGIQIDVGFAYNGSGNPLLYITGSSSGNQMYYRLT
jgi:hypothetical protein